MKAVRPIWATMWHLTRDGRRTLCGHPSNVEQKPLWCFFGKQQPHCDLCMNSVVAVLKRAA